MKKGLVIIYDPHALMQFLQFYCMGEFEAEWDALCLPKENGKEEMHDYCEKTGIFNHVFRNNINYQTLPIYKKIVLFFLMLIYALVGQRKKICKKIFNKYVDDVNKYDIFAANCENGFISGMIASFGKDRISVYFEDGVGDYIEKREKNHSCYKKGSFQDIQCVLMARLGYFGKGFTYLEPTKYCYKYASNPEELAYRNYKEIKKFHLEAKEMNIYREIIEKIYPELVEYKNIDKDSVFIFTTPIDLKNPYGKVYKEKIIEYINQNAKHIYLKQHPRENMQYTFSKQIIVQDIPPYIPAEVLFPYVKNICYMMEPDSLLITMGTYPITVIFLYFDSYEMEERKIITTWHDREKYEAFCNRFMKNRYKFLEI